MLSRYEPQYLAPWGLDRLDHAYGPLDYTYDYTYAGEGVDIYVVDSGIETDTSDLSGRVKCEVNLISDESCEDGMNHGTSIASVAAGTIYGVAKMAKIKAIKIFNKEGQATSTNAIKALDYIIKKARDRRERIVVNFSIGGSFNQAYNNAIDTAVDLGVVVVAASGNEKVDACQSSPGSASKAITVAASDKNDRMYSMSNFGTCVDIVA